VARSGAGRALPPARPRGAGASRPSQAGRGVPAARPPGCPCRARGARDSALPGCPWPLRGLRPGWPGRAPGPPELLWPVPARRTGRSGRAVDLSAERLPTVAASLAREPVRGAPAPLYPAAPSRDPVREPAPGPRPRTAPSGRTVRAGRAPPRAVSRPVPPAPASRPAAAPRFGPPAAPRPVPAAPRPVPATPRPVPAAPRPVPAAPRPVPATPRPVPAAPRPVPAAPRPVPAAPRPVPAAPRPVPAAPRPVPAAPRPVPAAPRPVPAAPRPVPDGDSERGPAAAPRRAAPVRPLPRPPLRPSSPATFSSTLLGARHVHLGLLSTRLARPLRATRPADRMFRAKERAAASRGPRVGPGHVSRGRRPERVAHATRVTRRTTTRTTQLRPPPAGSGLNEDVRRRPTLPRGPPRSTIGAEELNFRVRNGAGCFPFAMATETLWRCEDRPEPQPELQSRARHRPHLGNRTVDAIITMSVEAKPLGLLVPVGYTCRHASTSGLSTQSSSWGPYRVNPEGDLILMRASRLDAFSGYPFRT
jgi:hypothetical protein